MSDLKQKKIVVFGILYSILVLKESGIVFISLTINLGKKNPSYQDWIKQSSRRKRVLNTGKGVREIPCSHF